MTQLVDGLDRPQFWQLLARSLGDYAEFDSYLVLKFSGNESPTVLAANMLEAGGTDSRLQDYLKGLFLLDPFFTHWRETRSSSFCRLDEVAPDAFKRTDYYKRYFQLNVVEDEVQFVHAIDKDHAICLALGSKRRFKPAEVAVLASLSAWVQALMRQRLRFEKSAEATPGPHRPPPSLKLKLDETLRQGNSPRLTARELEITHLILSGFSAKSISDKLAISAETVKVHKKHIYAKLGVESQSALFSMFFNAQ
jgi:DNA-binding CsgD family transcriptional regulator